MSGRNEVTDSLTDLKTKPLAAISLDLDNQWSYQKTHGDSGWRRYPSYLDIFIPPFLDLLDELGLKITFFVVGQDAAQEENAKALAMLTERGHEVGNHSFYHEPWFHLYSKDQLSAEISKAEASILGVTGQKPLGFRGPGFSFSRELVEVLIDLNYLYDATTLPTYLGPLARYYYFQKSNLTELEKEQRRKLFGGFKNGRLPIKPYILELPSGGSIPEIPVTTVPVLRIPFHLSYLLYISRYSERLMGIYFRAALRGCKLTGSGLSFLLHPLDFLDRRQVPALAFFPAMNINKETKLEIFKRVMEAISEHYRLVPMTELARGVLANDRLKNVILRNS